MRILYFISPSLASALLLLARAAFAQTPDQDELALAYGDKSSISIATGSQQPLRRAPAVATVITSEDIAAMGAVDLDEVMETVPGLHVSRTNTYTTTLYLIRGIFAQNNPQTLMLLNGIPMTTMLVGNKGNIWSGYPVENIARIEIIRGPGSALYGADAYSGVINIITKTARDIPGTQFGARAGSFNTENAWLQHGGKIGAVEVAAYFNVGHTDGAKEIVTADAQTRTDKAFHTTASLAPGPINTGYDAIDGNLDLGYGKWRLRSGYKLRDNVGTGAGIASALDPVGKERSERITADLSWTDYQFAPDWGMGAVASYLQYIQSMPTYLQLLPPGTTLPTGSFANGMIGAPETWERQLRLSAFATYSGFANHQLRFGLGHDDLNLYRTEEQRNFSYTAAGTPVPLPEVIDFTNIAPFLTPQRRRVGYFYAQDEWSFAKDWMLTAGVRRDQYSDSGGTTNPRLAVVWDAAQNLTAKLLYGRAFRAPAFVEEYSINNPVSRGNSNLRPETIKTVEAAFAWQARRDVQLNVNLFRYAMKDIIRTVPNAIVGTGATYNNTGSQNGSGMELELAGDISRSLRLSGHYAYQHSIDETTNQDAGYAPRHHLYARADWRFADGWLLSGQTDHVADRMRAAGDNRPAISDYTTFDLSLRADRGNNRWSFAASIRNLFNADVREPSLAPGLIPNDLPMAPRSFYLQMIYRM